LDFHQIHEVVFPGDVRPEDRVRARIRKRDASDPQYLPCRVWKLSPLGVELLPPESMPLVKGDPVDIEITVGGERSYFSGLVVDQVQENEHIRLIGIRLSKRATAHNTGEDRRRSPRWLCSEDFYPSAVAPGKVGINDLMRFQIRDISKEGLQLTCSLRNKFLLPGMTLALAATFPEIGQLLLRVRIVRVDLTSDRGRDQLVVGTEFIKLSPQDRSVLAQYLIQFSDADSLDELRHHGFEPKSVSKGVNFYFLKSEDDYRQVLELRLLAHKHEGTLRSDTTEAADMGDINDARARILIGKYRGKVVASGRVRFNELDTPLEHEKYFDLPSDFPRRDQMQEVSRLCTHPSFRRSDLLTRFFHFICSTSLSEDRPYYLMGSWPGMVPFYEKLGFRCTGLEHEEPLWNQPQTIMLGNAVDAMLGRTTDPIYWNIIWKEASSYAINSGTIQPTKLDRIRLGFLRALGPIAALLIWLRHKPRRPSATGT
tara:strand:+ start:2372 stop:3823 length:1452 start_codon:yes stop_codon:yes gene_type:complete